jgi:hypothetical protein
MDVRDIQAVLERAEAGTNPVGEDVVSDIRIWPPSSKVVRHSRRTCGSVASITRQPIAQAPHPTPHTRVGTGGSRRADNTRQDDAGPNQSSRRSHACLLFRVT